MLTDTSLANRTCRYFDNMSILRPPLSTLIHLTMPLLATQAASFTRFSHTAGIKFNCKLSWSLRCASYKRNDCTTLSRNVSPLRKPTSNNTLHVDLQQYFAHFAFVFRFNVVASIQLQVFLDCDCFLRINRCPKSHSFTSAASAQNLARRSCKPMWQ